MLVLKAVQRYQYLSEQPNKRRHILYILTKQYLLFALTRPSAHHIRTIAPSRTHRLRRASHMQWQAARACHASLPNTLHIYAKTEGHPHNYASPTSRECPQNQRKRIRLQITQYFEVYIRCCHTAACADTVQKKHFTTSWKSLFGHAGKPLSWCGKGSSAQRQSPFRTPIQSSWHTKTALRCVRRAVFSFFKVRKRADGSVSDASRHVSRHIAFSLSRISVVKIFYFRKRIFIHFHISLCHIRRRHAS